MGHPYGPDAELAGASGRTGFSRATPSLSTRRRRTSISSLLGTAAKARSITATARSIPDRRSSCWSSAWAREISSNGTHPLRYAEGGDPETDRPGLGANRGGAGEARRGEGLEGREMTTRALTEMERRTIFDGILCARGHVIEMVVSDDDPETEEEDHEGFED